MKYTDPTVTPGSHTNTGIEARMHEMLIVRGPHAIEMEEFKRAAGVSPKAFWNALSRLEVKNLLFRWTTEKFQEYIVLAQHRAEAYYYEVLHARNSVFDATGQELVIKRSPPFVRLADEEVDRDGEVVVTVQPWNRYAVQVA